MRNAINLMTGDRVRVWNRLGGIDDLFDPALWSSLGHLGLASRPAENVEPSGFSVEDVNNAIVLSVDLPGVRREDLKIDFVDDLLTVSGERSRELSANGKKAVVRHGEKFQRSFSISDSIDRESVEANLDNGVLTVVLPKSEAKRARSIPVQSGKSGFFAKTANQSSTVEQSGDSAS